MPIRNLKNIVNHFGIFEIFTAVEVGCSIDHRNHKNIFYFRPRIRLSHKNSSNICLYWCHHRFSFICLDILRNGTCLVRIRQQLSVFKATSTSPLVRFTKTIFTGAILTIADHFTTFGTFTIAATFFLCFWHGNRGIYNFQICICLLGYLSASINLIL